MEKRSRTLTPVERRIVAYHEAGHAIIGWMLQYTDPVLKVVIAQSKEPERLFQNLFLSCSAYFKTLKVTLLVNQ